MRIQIILFHALLLGILVARSEANLQINVDGLTPAQIAALLDALNIASNGTYTAEDINECDQTDSCPTGSSCLNNVGSYNCTCDSGYLSGGNGDTGDTVCNDIDECADDTTTCDHIADSTCQNEPGSFVCTCDEGYEIVDSACLDINECTGDTDPCVSTSDSTCNNLNGSFECTCDGGYQLNADMTACEDINECDDMAICSGEENSECVNSAGGYSCICLTGFERIDGLCVDIIECDRDPNPCASISGSSCANSEGGYDCTCEAGFQINTDTSVCEDIDECDSTFSIAHDCGENEVCANGVGNYTCECASGFSVDSSGVCSDLNECDSNPCDVQALCDNQVGGYNCICLRGFFGSGEIGNCTDVLTCSTFDTLKTSILAIQNAVSGADISTFEETLDNYNSASEKADGVSGASFRTEYGPDLNSYIVNVIDELRCDFFSTCAESTDEETTYTCECVEGYQYFGESTTQCEDIDECEEEPCGSMATCHNNLGSYTCTCPDGYEIVGDIITNNCTDIDECGNEELHNCDTNAECGNIDGSFTCTCMDGFMGSGQECESALSCEAYYKVKSSIDTIQTAEDGDNTSESEMILGYYIAATGKASGVNGTSYRENLGSDLPENVASALDLLRCDYYSICIESIGVEGAATTYSCSCMSGYAPVPDNINQCLDEDECALEEEGACGVTGVCENQQGTYMCICNDGFEGGEGALCSDIDECTLETHECGDTGTCENKDGGYSCICSTGYAGGDDGPCTDINECEDGEHNCHADANCTNNVGSFSCECNVGHAGDGETCEDIDECETDEHDCDQFNGVCTNNNGSFTCACADGYMGTGYGDDCEDVTTCETFDKIKNAIENIRNDAESTDDLQILHHYAIAVGKATGVPGDTYRARYDPENAGLSDAVADVIDELRCDFFSTCSVNNGSGSCTCIFGYQELNPDSNQCGDIDECDGENECHPTWSTCNDTEGSYECECKLGFTGNGRECEDINECMNESHTCDVNGQCTNVDSSFECSCLTQFMGTGQDGECASVLTCDAFNNVKSAIDVIQDDSSSMESVEEARNFLQVYSDAMGRPEGVIQNAFRARFNINDTDVEDTLNTLRCDYFATCSYDEVAYSCDCIEGYELDDETGGCKDINECADDVHSCHADATCTNVEGSYNCECNVGYFGNGFNCSDHDECSGEGGGHDCDAHATCDNIEGGHTCTCNETYYGNGYWCQEVNTCEAFNNIKSAIAVIQASDSTDDDIANARKTLQEYHQAMGKLGGISGNSYRYKYSDTLDGDIANVIDELMCDYHSSCTEESETYTCTCDSDHVPASTENTCLNVQSCVTFERVKSAIRTVRENSTDEATEAAREVLRAYTDASGHATAVEGDSYRARYGDITDDQLASALELLPCDYFSECTDILTCSCINGYQSMNESNACTDVDECVSEFDNDCHTDAACTNSEGSFECDCNVGFEGDGRECTDQEECSSLDSSLCGSNAECLDTVGSFECTCSEGYSGDGQVCFQEMACLFNEDSDGEVDDCSTYDHPLSCAFRQEVPVRAERHFAAYRAFMQPPTELVSSVAATRDEANLTVSLRDNSDVSFCKKSTTYASPSKAYSDVDETMEVELFSYNCHRQWFTVTECAGSSDNINAQCTTIKTPHSALVITKDASTGKYEVTSQMVYLPSSCQLGFSIAP